MCITSENFPIFMVKEIITFVTKHVGNIITNI